MEKKNKKIKVKIKEKIIIEKKKFKEEKETEELEEIVSNEFTAKPKQLVKISPNLEFTETLENQIANVPVPNQEQKPEDSTQLYQSIKYEAGKSDYQSPNAPYSTITLQDTNRNQFSMPFIRPANPFETQEYPKPPEKNYETNIDQERDKDKRRRF